MCCSVVQKHAPTPPPVLAKRSDFTPHIFCMMCLEMYHTPIHPCSRNTLHAALLTPLLSNLQPIGRAFALVQPASDRTSPIPEPVKSTEEQVEVIKVGVTHWLVIFEEINGACLFRGHVGVLTSVSLPVSGLSRGPQARAAETPGEPEDAVRRSFTDTGGQSLDSIFWSSYCLTNAQTHTNVTVPQPCLLDCVTILHHVNSSSLSDFPDSLIW